MTFAPSFRVAACILLTALATLPLGCATGGSASGEAFQPEVVQPDQAVMYIYRGPHGMSSRAVQITVNQTPLAEIRPGQYVAAVVTPGSFLVRVEANSSAARELRLRAGDVAYLRIDGGNKPTLKEPETDIAQREIAKTRRIAAK